MEWKAGLCFGTVATPVSAFRLWRTRRAQPSGTVELPKRLSQRPSQPRPFYDGAWNHEVNESGRKTMRKAVLYGTGTVLVAMAAKTSFMRSPMSDKASCPLRGGSGRT